MSNILANLTLQCRRLVARSQNKEESSQIHLPQIKHYDGIPRRFELLTVHNKCPINKMDTNSIDGWGGEQYDTL